MRKPWPGMRVRLREAQGITGKREAQEPGSRVALRDVLLDLRTSRVRRQSVWPGNFKRIAWLPAGSFSVAGALPRNLSSTKISALSGSEVIVTVPTPSGAAEDGALEGSSDGVFSRASG